MKPVPIAKVLDTVEKFVKDKDAPIVSLMKVRENKPFLILVGTILSARTNDRTTTEVCRRLFKVVRKPSDFDRFTEKQVAKLIYPVGFYKTKAKSLKMLPSAMKKFKGKVPQNIDDLLTLPGVGRKTANIVLVEAFNKHAISVDIHVFRITNRLGYVKTKSPEETEQVLRKKLPKKCWKKINPTLVAFGQTHCFPVSPKCSSCPVRKYCNRVGVRKSR